MVVDETREIATPHHDDSRVVRQRCRAQVFFAFFALRAARFFLVRLTSPLAFFFTYWASEVSKPVFAPRFGLAAGFVVGFAGGFAAFFRRGAAILGS